MIITHVPRRNRVSGSYLHLYLWHKRFGNRHLWLTRVLEAIGHGPEITDYNALLPWHVAPESATP